MSIVSYNNRSISSITAIPGTAQSLTHIKTLTASSDSTLSFVNGSSDVVLDSTYPIYIFKFINIHPGTDNTHITFNFSIDSGSNYNVTKTSTLFRSYHDEADSATALEYRTDMDLAQSTGFQKLNSPLESDNDSSGSGYLYLFNPSSTTFVKHFISNCQSMSNLAYSIQDFVAGYGNTTSAVDAIQFKMSSGNVDAGTIKLYGIKDS